MSNDERIGDWIATASGGWFWPLDPRPEEIHIVDIAHHLSMQCRYAGAVRWFYSTAEHSVLLSHAVDPEHALAALLHDGGETYLPDMVRPTKRQFPAYTAAEERIRKMIFVKYGLAPELPAQVKEFDDRICADEKAALLPNIPWNHNPEPLGVRITGYYPPEAKSAFLYRFAELTSAT
ncbi:hydrolase [EBPR siphovirus 2]|nr:hydrolase [EBPR siphovirus 2]